MAADSLVARRRAMPQGGSAWRSAIQAPHHQTDRDVGAASIGAGPARRLRRHATTPRYLRAAARRATSCSAWPSRRQAGCAGPTGPIRTDAGPTRISRASTTARQGSATTSGGCTSVTHEPRFRAGALAGMRWLVAQAEGPVLPAGRVLLALDGRSGLARRSTTASAWARRASCSSSTRSPTAPDDASFRAYARAGAAQLRRIDRRRDAPAATRLRRSAPHETGFLSGSAGAAYMFLERYRRDRDPVDLATARRLLAWVDDQAVAGLGGNGQLAVRRRGGCLDGLGLRARSRRHRVGEPAGLPYHRRRRLPRARATGRKLAAARRRPRRGLGRAARRCRVSSARRARQRRRRDRLGARGPGPRGHRHGREPRRRADGARRAPHARRATIGSERSGTRAGRPQVDGCAPSRPGTGAPPESPRSRLGSPAGPG